MAAQKQASEKQGGTMLNRINPFNKAGRASAGSRPGSAAEMPEDDPVLMSSDPDANGHAR